MMMMGRDNDHEVGCGHNGDDDGGSYDDDMNLLLIVVVVANAPLRWHYCSDDDDDDDGIDLSGNDTENFDDGVGDGYVMVATGIFFF